MKFDFDRPIDFRNGDSVKWNRYADRDVLPLWVADMDFAAPPAVVEALQHRVARATFGYAEPWPSLVEAVQQHLAHKYSWDIEPMGPDLPPRRYIRHFYPPRNSLDAR